MTAAPAAGKPNTKASAKTSAKTSAKARGLVQEVARRHFGEAARKVEECGGGLTNSVWQLRVSQGDFIIRTHADATKITDYLKEQWAMDAARRAGVPTARVLEVGNFADGRPYMIAEHVRGIAGTEAPERLAIVEQLGRAAAKLHAVRTHGFGPVFDWSGNTLSRHESWAAWLEHGYGVEARLAVLLKHKAIDRRQGTRLRQIGAEMATWRKRPVLQHGDLRLKNVIVAEDSGQIASVLDWDNAVSSPAPYWDLSIALHDLGIDEKEAFLTGYGMKPRAFDTVLPFVRFFNMLNHADAVAEAAAAKKGDGLERLRRHLQGGLDLVVI